MLFEHPLEVSNKMELLIIIISLPPENQPRTFVLLPRETDLKTVPALTLMKKYYAYRIKTLTRPISRIRSEHQILRSEHLMYCSVPHVQVLVECVHDEPLVA